MKNHQIILALVVTLMLVAATSAFGQSGNPFPSVTGFTPAELTLSSSSVAVSVKGSGFVAGSVVTISRSTACATMYVSSTELRATIPSTYLAQVGYLNISVFNPAPGGGQSDDLGLSVNNPFAQMADIYPGNVVIGTISVNLSVGGSYFVQGAVVRLSGMDVATSFVSSNLLVATIPSTLLQSLGSYMVTVSNPAPGGGGNQETGLFFAVVASKGGKKPGGGNSAMETGEVPVSYTLHQNYPNPFNPTTMISFDLGAPALVTLKVYNTVGQEVTTLMNNVESESGTHSVTFDAGNFASGTYIYRLSAKSVGASETGTFVAVKQMSLVK